MSPPSGQPELVVVREAGGIGDLVRIFAVLDAIAAKRQGPLVFCTHAPHRRLMDLCRSVAAGRWSVIPWEFDPKDRRRRTKRLHRWSQVRRLPYARGEFADETPVIDLLCPALDHELDTAGRVTKDRLECWAAAAGVWPIPVGSVRLWLEPAREWRAAVPAPLVAISAKSNASIRTWRNGVVHGRRTGRLGRLVGLVRQLGWRVALFGPGDVPADLVSEEPDICLQAARVAACDLFIGPDSGMLHLACAAGIPAVGVFGPTDGEAVLRCYDNPKRIVSGRWTPQIKSRIGCDHPCYGFAHAGFSPQRCGGSCRVLESVMEESVIAAARELIERRRNLLVRR